MKKLRAKLIRLDLLCIAGYIAFNLLLLAWFVDMSQAAASIAYGTVTQRNEPTMATGALRLTVQCGDGQYNADALPLQWERARPGMKVLIIITRGKWSGVAYDCEVLELGKVGN